MESQKKKKNYLRQVCVVLMDPLYVDGRRCISRISQRPDVDIVIVVIVNRV